MGRATAHFWPHPLGRWGGAKRSSIIKFQLQSQFQRYLNQTLCVSSQMKDIKHIRRDFRLVAWVMPQSCGLGGYRWGVGSKNNFPKFNQILFVSYLRAWHMNRTIFGLPAPLDLGGQKVKYHSIPITKLISKLFKPNCVCLLTNERYKTYQTGFSFGRLGHTPRVGLRGTLGVWGHFFTKIQPDLVCELLT